MLAEFTAWLGGVIKAFLTALIDVASDAAMSIVGGIMDAIVALFSLIPVPQALSQGLQSLFGALDSGVLFFVSAFGLPECLAMLGAAVVFRLIRKVVTLFQW